MKRSEMLDYLAYYISGEYSGEGDRETTQDHINEADFLLSKLEDNGMLPPERGSTDYSSSNTWDPEDEKK